MLPFYSFLWDSEKQGSYLIHLWVLKRPSTFTYLTCYLLSDYNVTNSMLGTMNAMPEQKYLWSQLSWSLKSSGRDRHALNKYWYGCKITTETTLWKVKCVSMITYKEGLMFSGRLTQPFLWKLSWDLRDENGNYPRGEDKEKTEWIGHAEGI